MKEIKKTVKSLEECGLLLKGASETIKNEAKEQNSGFISMLLDKLVASLLGSMLTDKGVIWNGESQDFYCRLILLLFFKYENIIKTNLNLKAFQDNKKNKGRNKKIKK